MVDPFIWQSKAIFSVNSENIKNITLNWEQKESFMVLAHAEGTYSFYMGGDDLIQAVDETKLKYYTYEFARVLMDSKNKKYKKLVGDQMCKITVVNNEGQEKSVLLFELKNDKGEIDKNHLVIHLNGTDVWGKISYIKMSPILKQADFFFKKN